MKLIDLVFFHFQLIDLCLLDIRSLHFKNSVIAASSMYHILPHIKISSVTGWFNFSERMVSWILQL